MADLESIRIFVWRNGGFVFERYVRPQCEGRAVKQEKLACNLRGTRVAAGWRTQHVAPAQIESPHPTAMSLDIGEGYAWGIVRHRRVHDGAHARVFRPEGREQGRDRRVMVNNSAAMRPAKRETWPSGRITVCTGAKTFAGNRFGRGACLECSNSVVGPDYHGIRLLRSTTCLHQERLIRHAIDVAIPAVQLAQGNRPALRKASSR